MNFVNDYQGAHACKNYGKSFLVLKPHVRARCTITNTRTYSSGEVVAPLKNCEAVLSGFNSSELWAICNTSKGYTLNSKKIAYFKEVHIHGSISFFQDVEAIYAPER